MPLVAANIAAEIQRAGSSWSGLAFPATAQAIGMAVQQWSLVPTNLALAGATSGAPGAGAVNGKLILVSNPALVYNGLMAAGVVGLIAPSLAAYVSIGLAVVVSQSGQYAGPSVGVAIGGDVSAVTVTDPVSLTALLNMYLQPGLTAPKLAAGLGVGISNLFRTMTGVGMVSGTPVSGPPTVGTSPLSKVV